MSKVDILGVAVDEVDTAGVESAILDCIKAVRKEVFAYANVHAVNLARKDGRFRKFLNESRIVYCDGEGIRVGARLLGERLPPRTALTRWVWDLGDLFQEKGTTVYLLGGRPRNVGTAVERWRGRYPRLKLVGYHHGYFDKSGRESEEVLRLINNVGPDVLFVGFGMPEQEFWIDQNIADLHVNAILPCGGMIDYLSGATRMPPAWMTGVGLEWVHRLAQDPARLWRRYLLGNPAFMLNILRESLVRGRK